MPYTMTIDKGDSLFQLRSHQDQASSQMSVNRLGKVIMPTGSGKTITMISDALRSMSSSTEQTIVVVAPTIALTNQLSREFLEYIDDVSVMHVHSGHSSHYTSTLPTNIYGWCTYIRGHKMIFTTYHSLPRIQYSMANVDTIYFDEAHNSTKSNFFPSVEYYSQNARRCFYFTASPNHSLTPHKHGMNDDVYGEVIHTTPTTEMIDRGYIVPPTLKVIDSEEVVDGKYSQEVDISALINSLTTHQMNSVLISCKNTTQLYHITHSERYINFTEDQGYTTYSISSKYGCFINHHKVRRDVMFKDMRNNQGKFILFHIETCAEGINLPKLDGIILLRKLNTIKTVQSIGRVLRLSPGKTTGLVILPTYSKYLKKSESTLKNLMERVYVEGETPIQNVRK